MKKIILIQTDVGYFDDVLSSPDIPLGLLRIASFLKEDYKITLIDSRRNFRWKNTLKEELEKDNVVCVGITTILGNSINQGLEASAYVKNFSHDIPVIWGGKHPTIAAGITLKEKNIDIIVRGEGEVTFNSLVRAIDNGKGYSNIKGISYKDKGDIVHNPPAELLNLDELPPVPYNLIDVAKYLPKMGGRKSINYESTRGCPVGCPFCYNTLEREMKWRSLSPTKVVDDISYLHHKYGIEHFYFVDDNLFYDIERLKQIASGLIENRSEITWDTQGACLEDIYNISKDDLQFLKDSGLVRLAIGIQSGSKRIRKLINSRITDDQIFEVNQKLKSLRIKPHYYFMVGFPGETKDERFSTIKLALKLLNDNKDATTSSFLCYAPWPGTKLFNFAQSKYGLKKPESLDYWIKEWDFTMAPWLTDKEKESLHNLFMVSMLYDKKSEWYSDSNIVKFLSSLYRPIARFRIRHMFLNSVVEAKLIDLGKATLKQFRGHNN